MLLHTHTMTERLVSQIASFQTEVRKLHDLQLEACNALLRDSREREDSLCANHGVLCMHNKGLSDKLDSIARLVCNTMPVLAESLEDLHRKMDAAAQQTQSLIDLLLRGRTAPADAPVHEGEVIDLTVDSDEPEVPAESVDVGAVVESSDGPPVELEAESVVAPVVDVAEEQAAAPTEPVAESEAGPSADVVEEAEESAAPLTRTRSRRV